MGFYILVGLVTMVIVLFISFCIQLIKIEKSLTNLAIIVEDNVARLFRPDDKKSK